MRAEQSNRNRVLDLSFYSTSVSFFYGIGMYGMHREGECGGEIGIICDKRGMNGPWPRNTSLPVPHHPAHSVFLCGHLG